ncbi:hypothetical protein APUTEX25_003695 [Auxenochlorella protothecoides]|uniref:FRA10AC1-like protein n=2 Tax=Auxenochlorella protothecoides TaxID=3075 RepID=A0A3M7KT42_AUXPR|nr:hypothetical protein APUTEX25_003695 [Auxenochlorella protothecoides]|eukprot:RMZ52552.1 hypothetical protein APUTEX25_003695 [Auxenochlorella protothecoides]
MDAAAEEELSRTYLELYVDYRMTVTGLYFTPLRGRRRMASAPHAAQQRRDSQAALMAMGAYERHRRLLASLARYGAGARGQDPPAPAPLPSRTDADVLRDSFRFIRSDAEDAAGDPWEVRLARRYYAQLYREYAIADLSRHRESRLGLRWRTQREVVAGKGQFSCGAVGCEERRGLASFEVPFAYCEAGRSRVALVKVRLCPKHALQLNHRKQREAEAAAGRARKRRRAGPEGEGRVARGREEERGRDASPGPSSQEVAAQGAPAPEVRGHSNPAGGDADEFAAFLEDLLPSA